MAILAEISAPGGAGTAPRLARLGRGMLLLAGLLLAPFAADWLAFAASWAWGLLGAGPPRLLQHWPDRIEPREFLPLLWALALGLAMAGGRRPHLARAAAFTFAALALDRLAAIGLGLAAGPGGELALRHRTPWLPDHWQWRAMLATSAAVLVVAAVLAGRAWGLDRAARRAGPARGAAMAGRMAALGALLFGGLLATQVAWDSYLHVLVYNPRVRDLVLRSEPPPPRVRWRYATLATPLERAISHVDQGAVCAASGRWGEARSELIRGTILLERLCDEAPGDGEARSQLARARNNLAWLLATCPDESLRDLPWSIKLAQSAVSLAARNGEYWNTLGVALYRLGRAEEAERALAQSMSLRNGGDAFDWYFQAMLRADAGDPLAAVLWLDEAAAWSASNRPGDPELAAFAAEAAGRLGVAPLSPVGRKPSEAAARRFSRTGGPIRARAVRR